MVREPREVRGRAAGAPQRRQRRPVQLEPAMRVDRLLDREPRELVPERDSLGLEPEHPGGEALVERADGFAGDRLQQPQLGARRHDRDRIEEIARLRLESRHAREDGVAHAVRDLRAPRAASTSPTKNGFPAVRR